jgi:GNAT superfamily N-acetyltransferase
VRRASGDVRRIEPEHEMPLTIRSATVADVPLILDLIRGLAEYERLPHEVVATEALLRETLFGPAPGAEVLLAELDGESAGFALFFHNFSTFLGRRGLYLEDLFVRPAARGRGVGRALLARLAAIARQRGCGRFEWSVLDWNEPAIGFYRSLGAVPMDDWTVYRVAGPALDRLAAEDAPASGASSGGPTGRAG